MVIHLIERGFAQRFRASGSVPVLFANHGGAVKPDEPLRGRQKDHRIVASPAVRVLVRESLAVPEQAPLVQRVLHLRVGVEHPHSSDNRHRVQEVPGGPDWRVDLEAVLHAGIEVVGPVAGRGVHGARSGLERHVFAQDTKRVAGVQRMTEADVLQPLTLDACEQCTERASGRLGHAGGERLGHDNCPPAGVVRAVLQLGMKRDGEVRWNRPGCRGPDEDRHPAARELGHTGAQLTFAVRR